MKKNNLDQELEFEKPKLNISNQGGTTIITVSPVKLEKIKGVRILVEVGLLPHLIKLLKSTPNADAARILGIHEKTIDRLRGSLGLRRKYKKGARRR